jgi:hypothetical protein
MSPQGLMDLEEDIYLYLRDLYVGVSFLEDIKEVFPKASYDMVCIACLGLEESGYITINNDMCRAIK